MRARLSVLLLALALSSCKRGAAKQEPIDPAGSSGTSGSAAPSGSASAAGPPVAPPFDKVLDYTAKLAVQRVRGDAIWMTTAPSTEDRLAACAWEPGARLKCQNLSARFPDKFPYPTTAIGAQEPLLVASRAQRGNFNFRGEPMANQIDPLATRHADGTLSVRDRTAGLVRFAEPGKDAKPERIPLPPGATSLDLVGELVLTTKREAGNLFLYGRRLPGGKAPIEAEKKLGTIHFVPDTLLTTGCVYEKSTIAWLVSSTGGHAAAVFHGEGGFKDLVEVEIKDGQNLQALAREARGLACGEEKITWVFPTSASKIKRVRCMPNGCVQAEVAAPAPLGKESQIQVAPLGDRILSVEMGRDATVPNKPAKALWLRVVPMEGPALPAKLVAKVDAKETITMGQPVVLASARRVLVVVGLDKPAGTAAWEMGPEGLVTVFGPSP